MADKYATPESIDPFTGLPEKKTQTTDPFTGKSSTLTRPSRPALTAPDLLDLRGTPSTYLDYGVPVLPGLDLEEMRAQRQGRAEKWGRGLMKAGVTFAGAVAENTIGYIDGIGEAIAQKDWTKLYDNETGRAVDSMNRWMQENYPNYYTKKEQEAIGLENLGYANFWADKAANGLGYAVASAGTLIATMGTGLIARGVGLAAKAVKAGSKSLGMYRGAKSMATGAKITDTINRGAKIGRIKSAAKQFEVGISMSHAESSVEAREMLNHAYDEAALDIAEARGVTVQELTAAERQEARDIAARIGNFGYASNLAVVGATNLITFGNTVFPKFAKAHRARGFRRDKLGKWTDEWASENSPMWKRTASRYLQEPVKDSFAEAFQEGTQFAIQSAAEQTVDEGGPSGMLDWMTAVGEGWGDTVSEKEGIESMLLGFIIGGFMGGAAGVHDRIYNYKDENKQRGRIVKALNSESFYKFADKAEALKMQERYAQRMQVALEKGDHRAFRDAQFDMVLSQVMMHDNAGTLDMFMEKLDDAKNLDAAEFSKAFGIPEGVEVDPVEIVSDLERDIKTYMEMKDKVDNMFPTEGRKRLPALLASKEKTEEEKQRLALEHAYKQTIIRAGLRLGDIDSRIEKMTGDLNDLFSPLEEEQRAEAERLISRLQYNSSKIRRLEKKKRNSPNQKLSDEDQQTLDNLYAELNQAKDAIAAETIEEQELEADRQNYKQRLMENEDVNERVTYLQSETSERLRRLVTSISDPIKRTQAIELYRDLTGLAASRVNTAFALEELMSDPEERAAAVLRDRQKKAAEAQAEIDKFVDEQIDSTSTADELRAAMFTAQDNKVSDAAKRRMRKAYDDRVETEAAIANRLDEDDVSTLEARVGALENKRDRGEELTKEERVELHVANKRIAERKAEGKLKGNATLRKEKKAQKPEPTPKDQPKQKLQTIGRVDLMASTFVLYLDPSGQVIVAFEGSNPETTPIKGKIAKDVVARYNEENGTSYTPVTYDGTGNAKETQTQEAAQSEPTTTGAADNPRAPKPQTGKLQIQNGELQTEADDKTVVFENGQPLEGNDKSRERKIDRDYLKTEEGYNAALNSDVEFEMFEEEYTKDGMVLKGPVIYVKLGDRYIGVLPDPTKPYNPQSQQIMQQLMEGKTVVGKLTGVEYAGKGNFITETNEQGQPVMKNIATLFADGRPEGFVSYGVVRRDRFDVLGPALDEAVYAKAGAAINRRRTEDQPLTAGQIVMVFKLPNGDFTAIPMSTNKLGDVGLGAVKGLLLESDEQYLIPALQQIAGQPADSRGVTGDWNIGKDGRGQTKFLVTRLPSGKAIINFEHQGKIIGLDLQSARALLTEGKVGTFSYGKMVNFTDEAGNARTKFQAEEEPSTAVYTALRQGMKEALEDSIRETRRQVDGSLLGSEGPYTDPLTGKTENEGYDAFVESDLLTTDVRFHKGLPTFDHRITLEVTPESVVEEVAEKPVVKEQTGPKLETGAEPSQPAVGSGTKHDFESLTVSNNKDAASPEQVALEADERAALAQKLGMVQSIDEDGNITFTAPEETSETGEITEVEAPKEVDQEAPTQEQQAQAEGELSSEAEEKFTSGNTQEDLDYYSEQIRAEMAKRPSKVFDDGSDVRVDFVDTQSLTKTIRITSSQSLSDSDLQEAVAEVLGVPNTRVRIELKNQDTGVVTVIDKAPFRLASPTKEKIDRERAIAWLSKRFGDDAVVIYEQLKMVGDDVIHGYMTNGAVHLFSQAEVGTEYHEGFHLFFRTLLTNEQRAQLYEDAVKMFGEPTAEDIAKARRGQRNLTDAEARRLAIEEKLAEEFRDYVISEEKPKSMGQRILKFFKDLLVYIKALAGAPMTVNAAFSMIESNRIPKKYTRTAQSFAPGDAAFRMRQFASDVELGKELRDLVIWKVLNAADGVSGVDRSNLISDLLGSPQTNNAKGGESLIRNWFLQHAFHVKGQLGTRALTNQEFEFIKASYDKPALFNEVLDKLNISLGAPDISANNEIMPEQMTVGENQLQFAQLFMEVYEHWHDKRGELGGVLVRGYRSDVRDRLRDFGERIYDLEVVGEISQVEDNEEGADRIYSVARSKVDPASTLGDKARRALSRIPVQKVEQSRLGFQTYIPIEDIYNEIAATVVDSANFVEMMEKIKAKSNEITSMAAVYEFMNSLPAQEKALMYSVFAQAMTPFKLIKIENDSNANRVVKIISSSENSIERYFAQKWKDEATGPRGIYRPSYDAENNLVDMQVDEARRERAVKLYSQLREADPDGKQQYRLLGEMLMELGINIAPNKKEAARRVEVALEEDRIQMVTFLRTNTNLHAIMTQKGKLATKKDNYPNIFETESRTMNAISSIIMAKFEAPKATSFFNGMGNLVYPINKKNDMHLTMERIKSGELADLMQGDETQTGVVGSVVKGPQGQITNSFAHMLISTTEGRNMIEFVDIDSLKIDDDTAAEFDDFSYKDGLLTDLAMFSKNGEVRYIAVDTQGDRSKLTYMAVPNIMNPKVAAKMGLGSDPLATIIERTYLLDLHRMHVASKASPEEQIEIYHSRGRYTEFQLGGPAYDVDSNLAVHAYTHLENGTAIPKDLRKAIDKYVADTKARIEGYREDIVAQFGGQERVNSLIERQIPPGAGSYVKGKYTEFLDEFVQMSVLGRLASRELLRSGVNYVKDGADYVKRSALSSTPGDQLFTLSMNTDPNNPDYGMLDEFNEIAVKDVFSGISSEDRALLKESLAEQVGEVAAEKIIAAYDESNGTDAQGLISIDMYRRLRMGQGQWTAVDEEVYNEYKSQPRGERKWDGKRSPIVPMKPAYEYRVEETIGGRRHLLPISHKNSYTILTDEVVQGIPVLQNLVSYMEDNDVHVVNTESAKKLASFTPVPVTRLSEARIQTLPSAGLKFPQVLPNKKAQKITFGRQPRKNMIANIDPKTEYFLEDLGMTVTGKDLIRMYQNAVIAKLNKGHDSVLESMGYDKVLAARESGDENAIAKATQEMLPKLRDLLSELGVEKDVPQNILDALNVVADSNGLISTTVPLSFPTVQAKLDSLIMGMFRRGAYLQKLTGAEMVQFAEFGAHETDGALGFYTIEEATDSKGKTFSKVAEAEVDIRRDVLEAMGVDPDANIEEIEASVNKLLGYRIPQQGKSSMLMMRIRKVLPSSHVKAVRIPPQVTTMMGSDFDIDKMFVIFPEVNVEGKKNVKITKIKPDYNTLLNADRAAFEALDEKVLNNIIFDTFMAVSSNVEHIHESMTPLDMEESDDPILQGLVGIGMPTSVAIDINNPHARLQSAADNMLSTRLRGIYANAIAGRNVALTAMAMDGFTFEGPKFKMDGVEVGNLVEKSPFVDPLGVNRFTDYYLSQYLSKAVDSVKNPVQGLMNDNNLTAKLTSYMISIGMTPQQAIAFLNVPAIRELVTDAQFSGRTLSQALSGVDAIPMDLNLTEMQELVKNPQSDYSKEAYLSMLKFMEQQATQLANLYRVISPDNIDQAGTTPQHLAKVEQALNAQENGERTIFGGVESLRRITEGEAYPIVKAYYEAIDRSVSLVTDLGFIGNQQAVVSFKEDLKELADKDFLTDVEHRDINRAVLHHMVTKPGSPIFESGLLNVDYIRPRFVLGNLGTVMETAREAAGENHNPVLDAFTIETEMINGFQFTYLQIDKSKLQTKTDKDMFTYTLQGMMDNPALYGEENAGAIRDAIKSIIVNSVITTGFAPGMKSYFDLIPVEFWDKMGVREHLNQEMLKLKNNKDYLDDFKVEYLMSYGTHSARRKPMFKRTSKTAAASVTVTKADGREQTMIAEFRQSANEASPAFMSGLAGNKKILYQRVDYTTQNGVSAYKYQARATKGQQGLFYEAHLRNSDGSKYNGSLFDSPSTAILKRPSTPAPKRPLDSNQETKDQRVGTGEKETPKGARQKIARLRESFAKAGITVNVIETQLPLGVKGQVQGNDVFVDPMQMETDTVYHEFAHILVDMMPAEQVDNFVKQVIEADPELAAAVQAKYPELEGRELGKEILVTAIGREGAKIERKRPNKLQRIINRILRALGKVFGIKPNAAAVLAEQMFGAEIRRDNLSGEFNNKLRLSKDLHTKMSEVHKQVRDSLFRQRYRLEQLAESEQRNSKIREIEGLIRNIDEVKDKVDSTMVDLNEFFDFHEYVVTRVETLRTMMEELMDAPPPATQDEMFKRLNKIDAIRQTLDSLYTEDESTSTVVQMMDLLRTLREEGKLDELQGETRELMMDMQESLGALRNLSDMYFNSVIPMTTYTLGSYASPEAAAQIEAEKKRVKESGDLTGFRPVRLGISRATSIPEFKQLNSEYFNRKNTDNPMSREEFNEKAMEIKLRYLESKLVGNAQLTQELKEARKSKSVFSYWLDPIVYSRQQNLQLFAIAVKDALYKANDDTINFTYDLAPRYEEFKQFVGGSEFNQEEMNEALLTTVKVRRGDETLEVLSLVQQFDVDKYYSNYYKMLNDLAKKYNKPTSKDDKEVWSAWYKSEEGNAFYQAKAQWFAENTEPVGGREAAQAKYNAVLEEQNAIEDRIKQLETEANPRNREEILLLRSDYYKLDARRKKMGGFVTTSQGAQFVFMGELAQPKARDENGNLLYGSSKWETIQNTPELKKYYDFMVKSYHRAQAKLGSTQQQVNNWDKYSYIMPTIRKDGMGTLIEDGWKELLKEKGRDFRRLDTDTEYGLMTEVDGQEIRGIPKYYTQPADQKNVSRDLAASMTQFVHMANNYEQKSKIAGLVHSMLVIHERKGVIKQEKGLPVRDQIANLSRKANDLVIRRDAGDNKDLAHLQDFIDTVFYGVTDITGDIAGLSVGKTVGKLTGTTALVGLAGNLLQIGNQAVLDNLMTAQEAFTKQFFSAEDWAAAGAEYIRNVGALGDAGAIVPQSKLAKAMQMFDARIDVVDSLGQRFGTSKGRKMLDKDSAFVGQHSVEHQTSGVRMLAVLMSTKVKDKDGNAILLEDGKEANLYDMLIEKENGQLTIDPRVANVNKIQIISKIHGIAKRTNQVKGNFDASTIQRTAFGKAVMLFRNYFIPGLRRRYGHGDMFQVDHELGQVTKGYYQSLANTMRSLYDKAVYGDELIGMSEIDKQNMRRVAVDLAASVGSMLLFALAKAKLEDDDEDYTTAFVAYQSRRLFTELTGFMNPYEGIRLAARPMATINFIENYADLAMSLLYTGQYSVGLYFSDEEEMQKKVFYQRKSGRYEKGDLKLNARVNKILPLFRTWETMPLAEGSPEAIQQKLKFFE